MTTKHHDHVCMVCGDEIYWAGGYWWHKGHKDYDHATQWRGDYCGWREDVGHESECGNAFIFNDGGPKDNRFRYCPYCGKLILEEE